MAKKLVYGVTSSLSVFFLRDQVKFMEEHGYEVKVVCNHDFVNTHKDIEFDHIPFEREINIVKDAYALYELLKYLWRESPDIIHFSTPKAGLLGMMGGLLSRIPMRVYSIWGLRLETTSGIKYKVLYAAERIACALSTHVIVISESLEEEVVNRKIAKPNKVLRIGRGSTDGINLEEFNPENISVEQIRALKEKLNIGPDDFVLGYIGRIAKDKGCNELIMAFEALSMRYSNLKLVVVGDFEESDAIEQVNIDKINENENILLHHYTLDIHQYYRLMDLFVFPTHREGFGNVSIEAQAMGVPVVTFDVTGAKDTLLKGETGMIAESKDAATLAEVISYLIDNPEVLERMAKVSRKFVEDHFDRARMQEELLKFYDGLDLHPWPKREVNMHE